MIGKPCILSMRIFFILLMVLYAESQGNRFLGKFLLKVSQECALRKYPLKHDRIAIVGAGPAGVHMAYKLTKMGYNDITLFEKTDEVGGKCHTVMHKDTRHEMGAVYVHNTEYGEVIKLLNEFKAGNLVPTGGASRWLSPYSPSTRTEFPIKFIAKEFNITNIKQAVGLLKDALKRYIILHKAMFSSYEFELFPRPNATILEMTKGTFSEFLERNNMSILKAIFIVSHVIQGYNQLEEVPALYGLMWNTPGLLLPFADTTDGPLSVIDKGYQTIWKETVKQLRLKVVYNADITKIERRRKTVITYKDKNEKCSLWSVKRSEFDFLILASNIKDLVATSLDASFKERNIFNRLQNTYYATSLTDHEYGHRGPFPSNGYYYNVLSGNDFSVWGVFDSYGTIKGFNGENYTNGVYPGNPLGEKKQSSVFYQYGNARPSNKELNAKIIEHAKQFNLGSGVKLLHRDIWSYFPRFSTTDMTDGLLWDIFDMQGHKRTWYIGSSASFETVKSVLEYNKLLLKTYLPQNLS